MRRLDPIELKQYLAQASTPPLLLDVREPQEYACCHLEGSLHIPMREIPARLAELDKAREIVVICHHGMRSMQIAAYLEAQGFLQVINLDGGVDAWAVLVDKQMQRY